MTTEDDRTVFSDPERTILIPKPGGRATLTLRRGGTARPASAAASNVELQRLVAGINPLLGAANRLLALIPKLRATTEHADPAGLVHQLLEQVREFEAAARANSVPPHQISAARYVLCSFIDETIAGTPWGHGEGWAAHSLLHEFHEERYGGDKAFKLLDRLRQDPGANHHLLELFYVCLVLGFEGRYHGQRGGREQLDALADELLVQVRPQRDPQAARVLSSRWQGVSGRGHRGPSLLPIWVVPAVGAALLIGGWLFANRQLDALAQPRFRQIHEAVAALRLDRSTAAQGAATPRLAPVLQSDVAGSGIEVHDEPQRSQVVLPADALFQAGTAKLEPHQSELLARVARALQGQPGLVEVIGHTDDAPTDSLQFPSPWHLSRARAQAVAAELQRDGIAPERLRAEGRADAEPRAPNDSAQARARNRRVEIDLRLPRPDAK
jgi:type VI secretion system protein ImpK